MAGLRRSLGLSSGREKKPETVAPATDRRATLLEPVQSPAVGPTLLEPEWPPIHPSLGRRPGEAGRNVGMTLAKPAGTPTQSVTPATDLPMDGAQDGRLQGEEERQLRQQAERDYKRAIDNAIRARETMAADDGRSDLIHQIVRDRGFGTELGSEIVNRNFIAERDAYYRRQARAYEQEVEEGGRQAREWAKRFRIDQANNHSREFGASMEEILPDMEEYRHERQDMEFRQQSWYENLANEFKRLGYDFTANKSTLEALQTLWNLRALDTLLEAETDSTRKRILEFRRTELADEMARQVGVAADRARRSKDLPVRPQTREFSKLENWEKSSGAFMSDPVGVGSDMFVRTGPATVLGAMELGRGRISSGAAALGLVNFYETFLTGFLDNLKDRDGNPVNASNPQALRAALEDRKIVDNALADTAVQAGISAAGGAAGTSMAAQSLKIGSTPIMRMTTNGSAQFIVQSGIAFGETALEKYAIEGEGPNTGDLFRAVVGMAVGDVGGKVGSGVKSAAAIAATAGLPNYQINRTQIINGRVSQAQQAQATIVAAIDRVQRSSGTTANPGTVKQMLDGLGSGTQVHIPGAVVRGWIRDGKVDDDFLVRSGLAAGLNEKNPPRGEIAVDKSALATAPISKNLFREVASNIRMQSGGMTANEAGIYLRAREADLKRLADEIETGNWQQTDGALVYRQAFKYAREKGLDLNEARLEAARETERVFNQVVENFERTGKSESADVLFTRGLYRKTEPFRDLPPDVARRRENNWVVIVLRSVGKKPNLEYEASPVVIRSE